jgi:hypothetical protein
MDDLIKLGTEPMQILRAVLSNSNVRFVGFGESHRWNNPHRRLLKKLIRLFLEVNVTTEINHDCLRAQAHKTNEQSTAASNTSMTGVQSMQRLCASICVGRNSL